MGYAAGRGTGPGQGVGRDRAAKPEQVSAVRREGRSRVLQLQRAKLQMSWGMQCGCDLPRNVLPLEPRRPLYMGVEAASWRGGRAMNPPPPPRPVQVQVQRGGSQAGRGGAE